MKTIIIVLAFVLSFAALVPACGNNDGYVSKFTSIKDKDCKKLTDKKSLKFDKRRLDRYECESMKGWRIFTVTGAERSWLEIVQENALWSTEEAIVTGSANNFGNFQSLDFEKLEWIISSSGKPAALIVPVVAQDPEQYDKNLFRFFVIKFIDGIPKLCAVVKSARKATVTVNKSTKCLKLNKKRIRGEQ
jgi:hypothetical protein